MIPAQFSASNTYHNRCSLRCNGSLRASSTAHNFKGAVCPLQPPLSNQLMTYICVSLMYLYQFGQEIALHIQQRLHYQWKLVHKFAKTVLPLSHKTSRDFVHICNTYGVDLPSYVTRRLCPWCSVIQLPAITCSTKLQKRTRRSQANIHTKKKLKNEVVCQLIFGDVSLLA